MRESKSVHGYAESDGCKLARSLYVERHVKTYRGYEIFDGNSDSFDASSYYIRLLWNEYAVSGIFDFWGKEFVGFCDMFDAH